MLRFKNDKVGFAAPAAVIMLAAVALAVPAGIAEAKPCTYEYVMKKDSKDRKNFAKYVKKNLAIESFMFLVDKHKTNIPHIYDRYLHNDSKYELTTTGGQKLDIEEMYGKKDFKNSKWKEIIGKLEFNAHQEIEDLFKNYALREEDYQKCSM